MKYCKDNLYRFYEQILITTLHCRCVRHNKNNFTNFSRFRPAPFHLCSVFMACILPIPINILRQRFLILPIIFNIFFIFCERLKWLDLIFFVTAYNNFNVESDRVRDTIPFNVMEYGNTFTKETFDIYGTDLAKGMKLSNLILETSTLTIKWWRSLI